MTMIRTKKPLYPIVKPAITFMNNLTYPKKFCIIGLLAILPVFVILSFLLSEIHNDIAITKQERQGIQYIRLIRTLVEDLQEHRGMVNVSLQGNSSYEEELQTKKMKINRDIEKIKQIDKETWNLLDAPTLQKIEQEWKQITNQTTPTSSKDMFLLHNTLIHDVISLISLVGDASSLLLDPELNTYYLMDISVNRIPLLIENLGQTRGLAAGIAAKTNITEDEKREIIMLSGVTAANIQWIDEDMQKVLQYNPKVKPMFVEARRHNRAVVDLFTVELKSKIINAPSITADPKAIFSTGTDAVRSSFELWDRTNIILDELLLKRVEHNYQKMTFCLVFSIVTLAIVLYLFIAMYFSVMRTVKSLTSASLRIAAGDFSTFVPLDTKDELRLVGAAFNSMNESVNEMITERDQARKDLFNQKKFIENVIQYSATPTFVVDDQKNILFWNRACEELTGIKAEEVVGTRDYWRAFYDTPTPCLIDGVMDETTEHQESEYRFLETSSMNPNGLYAERYYHLGDKSLYLSMNAAPIYNQHGEIIGGIETIQDLSNNQFTKDQVLVWENMFEHTLEAVMIIDPLTQTILWVNSAFVSITGYTKEEVLGQYPSVIPFGEQSDSTQDISWPHLFQEKQWRGEILNRRKNREVYPAWFTFFTVKDEKEGIINYAAIFSDISIMKSSEANLKYLALYDPLTTLPNRNLFHKRLRKAIQHACLHNSMIAVLFIDLDRFKVINDTLGHSTGDLLLQQVGTRLQHAVSEHTTVARWGGDEFAIILTDITSVQDAVQAAEEILYSCTSPFYLNKREIFISPSIGISFYPHDGLDMETLVKHADTAMYQAKENGRKQYQLYEPGLGTSSIKQLELENHLRKALDKEEFELYYQPQIDLTTGKMVGMEALIRWIHPQLGFIQPSDFIPLTEEIGMIVELGEWVLREACQQNKAWQEAGYPPVCVAVNLSAKQFQHKTLVSTVAAILEETRLDPQYLELELTETVAMDHALNVIETIQQLKDLGVTVSIDDFGTGYSSLSYLTRFPIDNLKIDRSFIYNMHENPDSLAIVSAIAAMSHSLKLKIIVEGVETHEHLSYVQELKCHMGQGYLFSKPLPSKEMERLLAENFSFAVADGEISA